MQSIGGVKSLTHVCDTKETGLISARNLYDRPKLVPVQPGGLSGTP